jgi:hypothetical protein
MLKRQERYEGMVVEYSTSESGMSKVKVRGVGLINMLMMVTRKHRRRKPREILKSTRHTEEWMFVMEN